MADYERGGTSKSITKLSVRSITLTRKRSIVPRGLRLAGALGLIGPTSVSRNAASRYGFSGSLASSVTLSETSSASKIVGPNGVLVNLPESF